MHLWLVIVVALLAVVLQNVHAWLPAHCRVVGTWTGQRCLSNSGTTSRSTIMMAAPAVFDWKPFKKATEDKMSKSVENIQAQLNTLRAGGASTAMLDRVFVDYFGTPTPLSQVARVSTSGAQQLVVEPFDKAVTKEIEKAISMSDLNLTPQNDGNVIRINVPPLTEDRRKELVKQAKVISEDGKVAVRNVRRDAVDKIKAVEKDKSVSKDDSKGFQDDLQKSTDNYIKKLEDMLKTKEKDLMKI